MLELGDGMAQVIVEGWLLGLSTGPYCLGACAPFLVPYLFAEGQGGWRANARLLGQFLLGRLIAYLLFGAVVGWLGQTLQPYLTQRLASIALALTAALMLVYALSRQLPRWRVCLGVQGGLKRLRMPFVLGLLIGINVCPPFVAGVMRLWQLGAWSYSVVFFLSFFAGTSLYLLPLLGISPFASVVRFQSIGTLSAILISLWFLVAALAGL